MIAGMSATFLAISCLPLRLQPLVAVQKLKVKKKFSHCRSSQRNPRDWDPSAGVPLQVAATRCCCPNAVCALVAGAAVCALLLGWCRSWVPLQGAVVRVLFALWSLGAAAVTVQCALWSLGAGAVPHLRDLSGVYAGSIPLRARTAIGTDGIP